VGPILQVGDGANYIVTNYELATSLKQKARQKVEEKFQMQSRRRVQILWVKEQGLQTKIHDFSNTTIDKFVI